MRFDLFSSNRLYDALVEAGYPEKDLNRRTLSDWIKRDAPPQVLRDFTATMLETQRNAAPSMTRRLLAGVIALEKKSGVTPSELAAAQAEAATVEAAEEADARLAAELEASQRRLAEQESDRAGGQSGASRGSKRQKRK